ncbi:MAG: hemolysin family protein [Bowdeniella nasicola]|nr:hemolysin family protein [Bowdeniella nasicola]
MHDAPIFAMIILASAGLGLGALLTMNEAALTRVTRAHAAELSQDDKPRAKDVIRLINQRDAAILGAGFVRVLAEMTAAVAITLGVLRLVDQWYVALPLAVAIAALALALITGTSPRRYGRRHPDTVVHAFAPLLLFLAAGAQPLNLIAQRFARVSHRTEREQDEDEAEEMRDMVDLVSESEHLEDDEREMLHSVFELSRTIAREVMVPRTEMVTIARDTPLDKALNLFMRSGFSRIPVVGESVEEVLGILYLKDVLRRVVGKGGQTNPTQTPAEHVARSAEFVPETLLVDELLARMQQEAFHMAILIDEYGGVAGLLTIEDILEELVGELQDEHDHAEPEVEELDDDWWRIPARLAVDDLGEIFDLPIDDDDVDTVGGLLQKTLGRVPIEGSNVEVQGLYLQAERAGGRRNQIQTVLARRVEEEDEERE